MGLANEDLEGEGEEIFWVTVCFKFFTMSPARPFSYKKKFYNIILNENDQQLTIVPETQKRHKSINSDAKRIFKKFVF